ncbi:MAG: cyclic nucleotide-binding domain-containing protein [Caldilineaceae bacterium]|nr:cyclic nucleotide-binding domain-containing protein [Caldilineaceae bacterium]
MVWIASTIKEHPFFQDLEPQHVQRIAAFASPVQFNRGQVIFEESGHADCFYLVERGLVALSVGVPGKGNVTVQTIRSGDMLGWSWLFQPYRWSFTARALEPTDTLRFEAAGVRQLCGEDCKLGYALVYRFADVIMQRLQATLLQLLDMYAAHSAPEVKHDWTQ